MNILFVCTGNTCRSVMAEFMMKRKLLNKNNEKTVDIFVDSAGVMADNISSISPNAKKVLKYFYNDFDIDDRRCKLFNEQLILENDIILTVTQKHKDFIMNNFNIKNKNLFVISEYVGILEDIKDPYMGDFNTYKETFQTLDLLLDKLINKLIN